MIPDNLLRPTTPRPHRLGALAEAFPIDPVGGGGAGWADVVVRGVTADNRQVAGGELFAAHTGAHVHGARFAGAAARAGAAAVLTDPAGAALLETAAPLGVPVLVTEDVTALLGELAAELYGHPGRALATFAVTGTNGKTTTAFMLDHALRALGRTTGLIGTVEVRVAGRAVPATLTTPQPAELQAMLAAMVEAGASDLVMEVSSHALALGRVEPLVYEVAGFTNLTPDHLDFHGDMESYFQAKAALFAPARSRRGVVLVDDAWGRRLADQVARQGGHAATLATRAGTDADWRVTESSAGAEGTALTLTHRDGRALRTRTALPGEFNLANAALAAVMVLESGVEPAVLEAALAATGGLSPQVPGRMEQLSARPRVVVDFAHNADALAQALAALRPGTAGRLRVLFGAAGNRDRAKRPEMGRLAVLGADDVVVTDDDPHDEPAAQIRAEVLAGATPPVPDTTVREIALREEAIRTVVLEAADDDTVLVAGRGHETVQEIAGVAHHLDDREEVRAALALRTGGQTR
ncbi:UDP-N-acetylmuramoyl-L-alanyl-D-glutamate--2,6-diaminopimelate ligase [Georgenia sp. SYP-B2076]|uniref:UDP-N-acetylmuramoyl-L-alanyl-D-glutamate--2, 6-diaminopimelate ligase n=1 Tax=Georgenia sp. SYP-B2076 TaxID=2495881 RepID=UPI001F0C7388|nr:UDP-N-acetylmuramoyl-L-alanyl-D-glutamate--2,6-diaminopimelate ligase [Georgenia sp. SYP-B2076]